MRTFGVERGFEADNVGAGECGNIWGDEVARTQAGVIGERRSFAGRMHLQQKIET